MIIKHTRNNSTFNLYNANLANKALPFISAIENIGRNATVLKNIAKAVKAGKSNVTYDFFVLDGLEDAIVKMALNLTTQERALKATKYDNLAEYIKAFKAWAKTPKAELPQEKKDNLKRIIAKAQILREGVFSKYCHNEIGLNDLIIAHGYDVQENTVKENDTITGNDS